jgi:hypothetical protein
MLPDITCFPERQFIGVPTAYTSSHDELNTTDLAEELPNSVLHSRTIGRSNLQDHWKNSAMTSINLLGDKVRIDQHAILSNTLSWANNARLRAID